MLLRTRPLPQLVDRAVVVQFRLVDFPLGGEHTRQLEVGRSIVRLSLEYRSQQLLGDRSPALQENRLRERYSVKRSIAIQRCCTAKMIDCIVQTACGE